MVTSAERMRALLERERRGLRRLTIDVSETDLQAIAERGSEGAASTDHDQQAQAVGSFSHRVTVTRHLLRLEKFDNRHSTHGLVAKLIEQA
jgi:hypothetical protein